MLDIKKIKEYSVEFDRFLEKRGMEPMSQEIAKLYEEKKQATILIQQLQQARNIKSKELAGVDKDSYLFQDLKRDVSHINEKLEELVKSLDSNNKLQKILDTLPNILDPEVPAGADESHNKLIKTYGIAKRQTFSKQHFELGENLKMMDFIQTAKISGSRFVTLTKDLAKLERALVNFMIKIHVEEFNFTEVSPPLLVRSDTMYNAGQLPKFADDSFVTTDGYRLIPTGEVPLVNIVADSIIPKSELPIRLVAYTPCFRAEAGSAGRDTRGMIRMHQFGKVELVSITIEEESIAEHEFMLNSAEEILRRLKLPYRVMLLCSGDTGFSAKKTYDIEVWLPGQNSYREISSCSNCGDFQARRMKARYKEYGTDANIFVHTLNGSALPIGRTMVAIMENYQNEDGSITIPENLVEYMDGQTKIMAGNKSKWR